MLPLTKFASIAKTHRERIAIGESESNLSYAELDCAANRIAHKLDRAGVRKGDFVAIAIGRSGQFIIAMLGVAKLGAVYVPLDPQSPPERNQQISRAIPIKFTLIAGDKVLLPEEIFTIDIEELLANPEQISPEPLLVTDIAADDLLYVIFTSGTTGTPNGVGITHGNLQALMWATDCLFDFDEHDVWSFFHSPAFDFSVWEIWGALLHGGSISIIPYWSSRNPRLFHEMVLRTKVTVLSQTPTAFRQYLAVEEQLSEPVAHCLRYVVLGGEALNPIILKPWFERYGDKTPKIINMFGITETTVHTTFRQLTHADAHSWVSDIGTPLPGVTLRLVDTEKQEVAPGMIGEILVAGPTVSVGYLNNHQLSGKRFIMLKFPNDDSPRTYYCSRDLARQLYSGKLEYIGRLDQQVKIRGFRIELGEIETALRKLDQVRDAVVLPLRDRCGNPELAAALVLKDGVKFNIRNTRQLLATMLPSYMIPTRLIALEKIPMTNNGKVDIAALSKKFIPYANNQCMPVLSQAGVENLIAEIFKEVIGLDQVNRTDNFLDLGGHSLMAVEIIERIREATRFEIDVRALFEEKLATLVSNVYTALMMPSEASVPLPNSNTPESKKHQTLSS